MIMSVRYEDYGTVFQANGAIVGAAEDSISTIFKQWLTETKGQDYLV